MSTTVAHSIACALPALQPEDPAARLIVFAVRQMGANGLEDASAAHAFLCAFGKDFRRPLLLMRTLMMELSAGSAGPIRIAPWCCPRITGAEAALLGVLQRSLDNEPAAGLLLADLLGRREAGGVLATATALAIAFADLGLPLG